MIRYSKNYPEILFFAGRSFDTPEIAMEIKGLLASGEAYLELIDNRYYLKTSKAMTLHLKKIRPQKVVIEPDNRNVSWLQRDDCLEILIPSGGEYTIGFPD